MAHQTAKGVSSKPARSQSSGSSSAASAKAPALQPNTSSKPNSLLGITVTSVSGETRRAMIAEAAYYIAEQRGFGSGREVQDWLLAEKQIDATLTT